MTVQLYNTQSDSRALSKGLALIQSIDVFLLEQCSVSAPRLILTALIDPLANYAYIPEFKRYYFIVGVSFDSAERIILDLKVDVLMTYAAQIKACKAVVNRAGALNNPLVVDSLNRQQTNVDTVNKTLTGGELLPTVSASNYSFVLTCYGTGGVQ